MKRSSFQFDFLDLKLNIAQIEKVIGYNEGESHENVSELIKKILKESETECQVKAEYAVFPITKTNDNEKTVEINDVVFNVNKIVYSQIKKSESVAVFLCTAGEWIGSMSRSAMKEGDLLTGYIYDIIGSEIVEATTDMMQEKLSRSVAMAGKKITNRYSPGYCGWDVAEQHKLFRLLGDNFCGIRLTPSALMDPMKSVSGFIGIGEKVKFNPYTCRLCDMKDCIYRKVKDRR